MYQGETITTTITDLPVPMSNITNVFIIFKAGSRTILEKTLKDCKVNGETIENRLTQAETLLFPRGKIKRSVIIITRDGSRFESDPCDILCGQTAKNEVLA